LSAPGRILALDIGDRRIGVALSDPLQILARPLTIIHRESRAHDFVRISQLVNEHGAIRVVCGYPVSLNGSEGPQGRRVRRYAEALREAVRVPVVLWDESYSTVEAEEVMQSTQPRLSPRERRHWVDAMAAAVILQSYLDAQSQPDASSPQDQGL
jgi:putative Holliday junction resolvase